LKPNYGKQKQKQKKMAVYIPAGELESRVFIYNTFHYWSNKSICYKF